MVCSSSRYVSAFIHNPGPAHQMWEPLRVTRLVNAGISLLYLSQLTFYIVEWINRVSKSLHKYELLFACCICLELIRVKEFVKYASQGVHFIYVIVLSHIFVILHLILYCLRLIVRTLCTRGIPVQVATIAIFPNCAAPKSKRTT